ncbi:MAG: metallophosphoesterase family protein [Desulfomonile tiedjei]|nr:metallophosphoesterase family protein [Desulfomonile tiedjei]
MRIGVLSDTHLRSPNPALDHILEDLFADTDLILHAGDIVTGLVLDRLEQSGVIAVCGNMDDYDVTEALPQMRMIPAEGKRIVLIHGWGSKDGLAERVVARLKDDKPDLVVYGHSHVPFWGKVGDVYVFNPGSASQNRYGGTSTVGVVEIRDGEFQTHFVEVAR